ncbi:MAG: ndhS [Phycisphaerales bacterium]|nr:ndhS [Phycisphaerales bacterium]
MDSTIKFTANGERRSVTTDSERALLDVLREDLGLTGAKYGCGERECGACSVLVDGRRAFSWRTPVSKVVGKTVVRVEGLGSGEKLHPVQEAFLAEGAFQCGYCTAGMIIAAVGMLAENPKPTDAQIVAGMDRNICRCCAYPDILRAVRRCAGRNRGAEVRP